MPDEPEVFIFEFDLDGVVKTQETRVREQGSKESDEESDMSQWLNRKDDDIASDIEREVRRVLRPFVFGSVTVQADVSFKPGGSLIIAGTVIAVMSALGTVTSQALSQALGQNLARLVEIPINRVLRRWLNRGNEETADGQLQFEPVSVGINPAPVAQTQRQATVLPASEESSAPPTPQEGQAIPITSGQEPNTPGIRWLLWTSAAIAILNTILLVTALVLLLTMAAPAQALAIFPLPHS